jgi:SAM-dependent methyltransferase
LPADYQAQVIARERDLLMPWVNKSVQRRDEIYFGTNRGYIADLAWPYLQKLSAAADHPLHVLEIGGGEGRAILTMLELISQYVPSLPIVTFTMTSLSEQPEQYELLTRGVRLRIPQIAERLPDEWTTSFDLVMTSAVFGWANATFALPEIRRVLRPGGYWVGLELFDGRPIYESTTLQGLIHGVMVDHQMENLATQAEYQEFYDKHSQFPVVYRK